jgi:ubiquinone biosynthesis protein Coq4
MANIVYPSELPDTDRTRDALRGIGAWVGDYATHVCHDPVGAAKSLRPYLNALLEAAGESDASFDEALRASPVLGPFIARKYMPERYTEKDLAAYAPGTVARVYHDFLARYGLTHDYYGAIDTSTPRGYMIHRGIANHDYWHVATGYGADPIGEIGAVAFTLGNRLRHMGDVGPKLSQQVTLTLASAMCRYALHYPSRLFDYQRVYAEGVSRGIASRSLDLVIWEEAWSRPLTAVRAELEIPPRPDGADDALSPLALAAE